jgi:hypothetical protein
VNFSNIPKFVILGCDTGGERTGGALASSSPWHGRWAAVQRTAWQRQHLGWSKEGEGWRWARSAGGQGLGREPGWQTATRSGWPVGQGWLDVPKTKKIHFNFYTDFGIWHDFRYMYKKILREFGHEIFFLKSSRLSRDFRKMEYVMKGFLYARLI